MKAGAAGKRGSFCILSIRIFFKFALSHQIDLAKSKENDGVTPISERDANGCPPTDTVVYRKPQLCAGCDRSVVFQQPRAGAYSRVLFRQPRAGAYSRVLFRQPRAGTYPKCTKCRAERQLKRNLCTRLFISRDCSDSSWDVAALSTDVEEVL